MINYCLGITKIDPIVYDLKFERFLNPDRISMPKQNWAYKVNALNSAVSRKAANGISGIKKIC